MYMYSRWSIYIVLDTIWSSFVRTYIIVFNVQIKLGVHTETIKLLRSIEISSNGLFDSKPNMVSISTLGNMSEGDDYIS